MKPVKVKFKLLNDGAVVPTRGSSEAAGYDLHADLGGYDVLKIQPHCTYSVGTGLAISIPTGYFGAIFARSGIARDRGIRPANCVGVIDSDYRGEVKVALHNDSDELPSIKNGERIAQLVILPCPPVEFEEVEQLSDTERGEGGFGSTGTGVEKPEHGVEQLSIFDC